MVADRDINTACVTVKVYHPDPEAAAMLRWIARAAGGDK